MVAFVALAATPSLRHSSFTPATSQAPRRVHVARARFSMLVGIIYGTSTENTAEVAQIIKAAMGDKADEPNDVHEFPIEKLTSYDHLVVGAPTFNTDADEERSGTPFDTYLYEELPKADLTGKKVAVFGLGDSKGYGDNFVDGIEEMHDCFAKQGAEMVGYVSTEGYDYEESKSERDGKFMGLAIDQDNEEDLTEERVKEWVAQISSEMGI